MKKLLVVSLLCIVSTLSFAQIEDIKLKNDSSIVINKFYVGMLSGSMFSADSLFADKFVDMRIGMRAEWKIANTLSLKSMAIFSTNLSSNSWGLQQVELDWMPNKKHLFQIGNMATISTEQRPDPVSGNGQFETWTEAQIPGQALGMKYTFKPNDNWLIGAGVAVRDNKAEYHGKIKVKNFTLSGYYNVSDTVTGMALTYAGNKIYNTCVWKDQEVLSNIFVWELSSKKNISFYADMGYSFVQQDVVRAEVGFLKSFSSKYTKGLFGLGYQYETNTINAYMFLHL